MESEPVNGLTIGLIILLARSEVADIVRAVFNFLNLFIICSLNRPFPLRSTPDVTLLINVFNPFR